MNSIMLNVLLNICNDCEDEVIVAWYACDEVGSLPPARSTLTSEKVLPTSTWWVERRITRGGWRGGSSVVGGEEDQAWGERGGEKRRRKEGGGKRRRKEEEKRGGEKRRISGRQKSVNM
jgi:hypothetical protein